jgi:MFS family permease
MLIYFDFTFFSVMKIQDKNNDSSIRKVALFFSYIFFVISIVAPVFFVALILKRFELFKIKEAKKNYNTLVLKIDKNNKWRVIHVAFFFGRRLITAILLTLPITSQFIFLQYVFILVTSHAYILYMVATKPFQTPIMNSYILANETFYSALIILIFIFSDATPQISIKIVAGKLFYPILIPLIAIALMVSIFLLVLANIIYIIYNMVKGKLKLKESIKEAKKKRIA